MDAATTETDTSSHSLSLTLRCADVDSGWTAEARRAARRHPPGGKAGRRKTYRINGVPWSAAAGLSRGALRLISRGETERRAFYASPRERDEARAIKYARWLADRDEVDISAADTAEAVWHGSYIGAVRFGKIGRAQVCTPVTNAQLVCRLLLE